MSFCPLSFGHCDVCPFLIYLFWLSLWYLQTLLNRSLGNRVFGCTSLTNMSDRCTHLPIWPSLLKIENIRYFCNLAWARALRICLQTLLLIVEGRQICRIPFSTNPGRNALQICQQTNIVFLSCNQYICINIQHWSVDDKYRIYLTRRETGRKTNRFLHTLLGKTGWSSTSDRNFVFSRVERRETSKKKQKFQSWVEDHPGFPNNVCKYLFLP